MLKFSISHSSEWIGTNNYHWWCYHDLWQHRPPAFPCPVFSLSRALYLKTFLWCLYNMTEHHLTTTLLIVGHTFAEIPKSAPYPYLFKKSLIYPHLVTLYPSLHTDGKSMTCPALDRVVSGEIVVLGAGAGAGGPVSSVSAVCISWPHLAAPCHHHHHLPPPYLLLSTRTLVYSLYLPLY